MQRRIMFMLAVLLLTCGTAFGQFSRGGGGSFTGGYGGGTMRQGGVSPGFSTQGPQSRSSHSFGTRTGETEVTIRQTPPSHDQWASPGWGPAAPPPGRIPSWGSGGRPHFRYFRPPHHHRPPPYYPGVVVLEVPRFNDVTITSQIISGGGWVDQPMARPYSQPGSVRGPDQVAPFDPTPQEVVERMLVLAGVKKGDVVYDLGAGDGRVVITAAKIYGVKAVGFEVDPGLVKLARENVREQGVGALVEIRQQDFLSADLSAATVVTLYLSYDGNLTVKPKLMRELRPGARIVSYIFDMGDWPAKIVEAYRDAGGDTHMLYLWHTAEPMIYGDTVTEIPEFSADKKSRTMR